MKEITFEKIILENFGIFKERIELDLPGSLFFIFGANGCGKSTLLNSFGFILYGMTPKNEKVKELINVDVGKNLYLQLDLKINGEPYRIKRFYKHEKLSSGVTVEDKDGNVLKSGDREVTPFLKELICPPEVFYNSLYFVQDFKNLFTNFSDIFYRILNLESYKEKYDAVKEDIKKLEKTTDDIKNKIYISEERMKDAENSFRIERSGYIKKLFEIKADINNINKNILKISDEISSIEIDDDEYKNLLDEKQKLIVEKKEMVNAINSIREKLMEEATNEFNSIKLKTNEELEELRNKKDERLNGVLEKLKEQEDKLKEKLEEEQKKKNSIDTEMSVLNNDIKHLTRSLSEYDIDDLVKNKRCPTCLSKIDEHTIENIKNEIHKIEDDINSKKEKKESLEKIKNEIEDKISEYKRELIILKETRDNDKLIIEQEYYDIVESKNKKLSDMKKDIGNKMKEKEREEREKYKKRAEEIDKTMDDIDEKINIIETMKNTKEKLIHKMEQQKSNRSAKVSNIKYIKNTFKNKVVEKGDVKKEIIKTLEKENEKLKEFEEEMDILLFWKTAFSKNGIPNLIISNSISQFNKWVSFFTDHITQGRYKVAIDMTKIKDGVINEKPNLIILDNETKKEGYRSVSGGYRRMIDVALFFSFNALNYSICKHKFNIIMMDELLDGLDSDHKGFLIGLIRSLKDIEIFKDVNMFFVSHTNIDDMHENDVVIDLN